ncbi:MAG: alpha-L-fucosidase, partial [Candidatus Aminicenantes bacterium]|nr:alpha-L-fucosidase [Candidatus Aminicenantes bacterium]
MSSRFFVKMPILRAAGLLAVLAFLAVVPAMAGQETEVQKEARMKWWTEARFGMFIHWGTYALAARHEWVKNNEHIPDEVYQKY